MKIKAKQRNYWQFLYYLQCSKEIYKYINVILCRNKKNQISKFRECSCTTGKKNFQDSTLTKNVTTGTFSMGKTLFVCP